MSIIQYKDGDIIGFSGNYFHSDLINIATYGVPRYSLSHVGILARKNKNTKWLVFEANEDVPWQCAVTHKKHDGVQAHSLDLLCKRYKGKIWYYECNIPSKIWLLRQSKKCLVAGDVKGSLYEACVEKLGVPYDWAGAKRSGGELWSWLQSIFRQEDTSSFFCSEFVVTMLREFGIFDTDNVSKWSPNGLMRELVREGIYKPALRLK